MKSYMTRLLSVSLVAVILGCGSGKVGEHLNFVGGSISFDSKLKLDYADQSIVEFHPKGGDDSGGKYTGTIIEGAYSIIAEVDGKKIPGTPEGDYIITITPPKSRPTLIPAKYQSPKTSDLECHVEPGINKIQTLELKGVPNTLPEPRMDGGLKKGGRGGGGDRREG